MIDKTEFNPVEFSTSQPCFYTISKPVYYTLGKPVEFPTHKKEMIDDPTV